MGDRIDVEGLAVALSAEAHAQLQMDDRRTKAREAAAARMFWNATGVRRARNGTRPPPRFTGRGEEGSR